MFKRLGLLALCVVLISGITTSSQTIHSATFIYSYQICEQLGILQGDGNGVTDEYLKKDTTRLQAAILFLRVKGLEEEALSFIGTSTFVDGADVTWGGGRAILAYLKAHPELGWVGDTAGLFHPNQILTVQAYYKVALEALGYQQGVDFQWANVVEYAISLGMSNARHETLVDNNLFAIMTVELLRGTTTEGEQYAQVLANANIIDETVALNFGLIISLANGIYELAFAVSDPDRTINADGKSQTAITATIIRRADGVKMPIYGMMEFSIKKGTLDTYTASIVNGQSTIWATSMASSTILVDEITAKVIDVDDYKAFYGLIGTVSITYDPDETYQETNYATVQVVGVDATTCDRLKLTFSGDIIAEAYKTFLVGIYPEIEDWASLVAYGTTGGLFIDGRDVYIKDIVQASPNQLTFILDTDVAGSLGTDINRIELGWMPTITKNYMRDNATHTLYIPFGIGDLVGRVSNLEFSTSDVVLPDFDSVIALDQINLIAIFSEALAENSVEMSTRGLGNVDGLTVYDDALQGAKDVFTIDTKRVYLTASAYGATQNEIDFAASNNLVLVNELYVGAYDETNGVDHRNKVFFELDVSSSLSYGDHELYAHNILDWAGNSDGSNVLSPTTINFEVVN
ncbi:MAG: hypothetical protein PF505_14085 [Vallitaleaceae bacterium]|jgi:hypothetical protein|nr:hypothetical protein [Vallitaleaceae bacterium]